MRIRGGEQDDGNGRIQRKIAGGILETPGSAYDLVIRLKLGQPGVEVDAQGLSFCERDVQQTTILEAKYAAPGDRWNKKPGSTDARA